MRAAAERERAGGEVLHLEVGQPSTPAPAPAPSDTRIDAGLMQRFEQGGWQVQYERYQDVAGSQLPAKIAIDNGETRARLVIRGWDLAGQQ